MALKSGNTADEEIRRRGLVDQFIRYPVSSLYPSLFLFLHRILCLHGSGLPLQRPQPCCCSRLRDVCRPPNRLLHRGSGGGSGGLQLPSQRIISVFGLSTYLDTPLVFHAPL